MSADPADGAIPFRQLGVVRFFDRLLPGAQDFIDLLDARFPGRFIQTSKRLLVIPTECRRLLAVKLCELLLVPEDEVIDQLNDGMVLVRILPRGLLWS